MIKRLLLLLCLTLTAGSAAWADIAQGTFKNGGTWKITDQGELYVDAVTIPDYDITSFGFGMYGGSFVIDIDNDIDNYYYKRYTYSSPWYSYMPLIKTIRLSSRVKTVGEYAFAGLRLMTKVAIEGSGLTLKEDAFSGCFRLVDFPFANGEVKHIGANAFYHCGFSGPLVLNGVLSIGDYAFDECYHLWRNSNSSVPSIVIKGEQYPVVESMHDYSKGYSALEYSLGDNNLMLHYTRERVAKGSKFIVVNDAGKEGTFSSNGVGEVCIGGDYWRLVGGGNLYISDKMDSYYASPSQTPWYKFRGRVTTIILNNYAKNVTANAFKDFTALQVVELPDNATIGANAFNGCTQLYRVKGLDKVLDIGEGAFASTAIAVADLSGAINIGSNAFDNATKLEQLILGEGVRTIGSKAFRNTLQSQAANCWIKVFCPRPSTTSDAFEGVKTKNLLVSAGVSASYNSSPWNQFTLSPITDFPVEASDYYCSWKLTGDGTLTVSGGQTSVMKNYASPEEQPWYLYRDYIKKVVVTSTVSRIGDYAFAFAQQGESRLQEIEIPTAFHVGAHAFENNDQLRVVTANNIQTINDYAFAGCSAIKNYSFGSNLESIGKNAFDGCKNVDVMALTAATPPEVTAETFEGMGSSSSQSTRRRAAGQKGVTLDVPEEYMTKYMANIYWRLFAFYTGEHGAVVKSGKYYDGAWVIYEDGTMIASSETSEGDIEGFFNQPSVKRVQFLGGATKLTWAGFGGHNLPNVEEIVLSPALTVLGDEAFKGLTKLKSINLENVLSIGRETFKGCTGLTAANLQTVEQIGDNAFEGCKGLTDVTLYGKGGKIGYYAFKDCTGLKSIDLSGINYAASGVFEGCSSLESVTFRGQALQIYSNMFKDCSALRSIDVCDDCWSIGSSSLAGTSISRIYSASPKPPVINETAFGERSLNSITACVPADYMNAYRKAPVWRNMNFAIDERYGEPQLPTGGMIGENGTWNLDETGALTIDCNGAMPQFDELGASTWSWNRTFDRWAGFIENVRYTDRLTSIAQDVTDNEAELGTYGSVQTVEIGTNVESIGANAMRYTNLTDVYCFAPEPPAIVTSEENGTFDMAALKAKGTTLHVVDFQGTLDKYRKSYRWNWFPNIVADLPTRKPGTIMVERVNVTSATGTRLTVDRSQLGKTTVQLEADVYPANADNTAVVWTSEDESVATVDENGLVTIKDYPEMMEVGITATAADGSNRKGTVSLYISNPDNDWGSVLCTGMEADRKTITITKSQAPVTLTVRLTPANSTANIDFDVENFNMVQVDAEYDDLTGRRTGVFRISAPDPMMVPEVMTGSTTLHFYTHYYDEAACNYVQPEVYVNVNIIEDVIFTEENVQNVPVKYAVTTLDGNICTVYGKWVDGHEEDGIFIDSYYDTAIDKDTKGLMTVPAKARNYYVTGVGAGAFTGCSQLEEVEFEQGIRFIGSQAFDGCSSLSEVLLPASIESFGWGCFMGLPNLKDVHILATTPPTGQGVYNGNNYFPAITDSNAFAGLTGATLHVPAGCRAAYDVYPWNYWFSTITEDAIDGIEEIQNSKLEIQNEGGWYDLSGRKIVNGKLSNGKLPRGIYINGGKKVVVK